MQGLLLFVVTLLKALDPYYVACRDSGPCTQLEVQSRDAAHDDRKCTDDC